MKNLISLSILTAFMLLYLASCNQKNEDPIINESEFDSMVVPSDFTWSTLDKINFTVNITNPDGTYSQDLNGFPLDVTDMQGNRLIRANVIDGQVSFYLELNKSIQSVGLYAPSLNINSAIDLGEEFYTFMLPENIVINEYIDNDNDGVYDDFDDFPDDAEIAFSVDYPSPYQDGLKSTDRGFSFWYYQVFEDLWPSKGDYDFNDLTLKIKMKVNTNGSGKWKSGTFDVYIWTNGAGIDLGCGIDFYKYNGSQSGKSVLEYMPDGSIGLVSGSYNPDFTRLDPNAENAIIVFNNTDDVKPIDYYNTGQGLSYNPMLTPVSFEWDINTPQNMRAYMYLYYATDRGHEIRTVGLPPTKGLDMNLLGTYDDDSPVTGWDWTPGTTFLAPLETPFFVTDNLHPWGIEIEWDGDLSVPFEKVDILDAFPQFQDWAESGGNQNTKWYKYPSSDPSLVFDVGELVTSK